MRAAPTDPDPDPRAAFRGSNPRRSLRKSRRAATAASRARSLAAAPRRPRGASASRPRAGRPGATPTGRPAGSRASQPPPFARRAPRRRRRGAPPIAPKTRLVNQPEDRPRHVVARRNERVGDGRNHAQLAEVRPHGARRLVRERRRLGESRERAPSSAHRIHPKKAPQ